MYCLSLLETWRRESRETRDFLHSLYFMSAIVYELKSPESSPLLNKCSIPETTKINHHKSITSSIILSSYWIKPKFINPKWNKISLKYYTQKKLNRREPNFKDFKPNQTLKRNALQHWTKINMESSQTKFT